MEIAIGTGLVVGPLIGSILYSYFGFEMTFIIVGASFYIMTPLFCIILPGSINRKDQVIKKVNEENSEEMIGSEYGYESVEYSQIIWYKDFLFPAFGAFLAYFVVCFGDPILSLRLHEFKLIIKLIFPNLIVSKIAKLIPYSTLSSPPLNDRDFAKLGGETRQRWFLFSPNLH